MKIDPHNTYTHNIEVIESNIVPLKLSNGMVYASSPDYDTLYNFALEEGFTWDDSHGFFNADSMIQAHWVDYGGKYHFSYMAFSK